MDFHSRSKGILIVAFLLIPVSLLSQDELENEADSSAKANVLSENGANNVDGGVQIDGVQFTFGQIIEMEGPCLTTDSLELRNTYSVAALRGLRIDGKANQHSLRFGLTASEKVNNAKLRSLEKGQFYRVRGKLTGARVNGPRPFCNLSVGSIEKIEPVPLHPRDFEGRAAAFEGIAAPRGKLAFAGETVNLEGMDSWPEKTAGKAVSVEGIIRRNGDGWQFIQPAWHLIELADMVGQPASLEGELWSMNGHWWFTYRDEDLYLTHDFGPPLVFSSSRHGSAVTVTGPLVNQLRPSLDQITLKEDRDLVATYVVSGAKVEFKDKPMSWHERFGAVYDSEDDAAGVPELIAQQSFRRNIMGNETNAMLFAERNHSTIGKILADASPKTCNVLAKRMNDEKQDQSIRLLYAALLARANDKHGQNYLLKSLAKADQTGLPEVLYCMGKFPFVGPVADHLMTDFSWAEDALIEVMAEPIKAKMAVHYSSIPSVLISINSAESINVLLNYALANSGDPQSFFSGPSITHLLCHPEVELPAKDLLKLEGVAKNSSTRRTILRALLRLKHPSVADRFLNELGESFFYMDIRDQSSPEVLAALQKKLPRLAGEAKTNVRMLILLGKKDPLPKLMSLLDDETFADKNLTLFELSRLAHPRAIAAISEKLQKAPDNYFTDNSGSVTASAIKHALSAIAKTKTREAVQELITLLSTDLGRFGGYIDGAGLKRMVATHLINMTGESFGSDHKKWQEWEQGQPDFRFESTDSQQNSGSFRTAPDNRIDLGQ